MIAEDLPISLGSEQGDNSEDFITGALKLKDYSVCESRVESLSDVKRLNLCSLGDFSLRSLPISVLFSTRRRAQREAAL